MTGHRQVTTPKTAIASVLLALSILMGGITGCSSGVSLKDMGELKYICFHYGVYYVDSYLFELSIVDVGVDNSEAWALRVNGEGWLDYKVVFSVDFELDVSALDDFAAIIADNGIADWNGFNQVDGRSENGYTWGLVAEYENGVIDAYGIEKYPSNWEKGHKALTDLLFALSEAHG